MTEEITYEQAAQALDECRATIAAFNRERLRTKAALSGIVKIKGKFRNAGDLHRRVQSLRDPLEEKRAAVQYREYMQMLLGRPPTRRELEDGPPSLDQIVAMREAEDDGMGILPALIGLAAIAGGAWSIDSIMGTLTERERRLQTEIGVLPDRSVFTTLRSWAVPAVLATGVGVLGYVLLRSKKKKKEVVYVPVKEIVEEQDEEEVE